MDEEMGDERDQAAEDFYFVHAVRAHGDHQNHFAEERVARKEIAFENIKTKHILGDNFIRDVPMVKCVN